MGEGFYTDAEENKHMCVWSHIFVPCQFKFNVTRPGEVYVLVISVIICSDNALPEPIMTHCLLDHW